MALSTEKKLRVLGLKPTSTTENPSRDNFERLREGSDYGAFRDDVTGFGSSSDPFGELETWLGDLDTFNEDQSSRFNSEIQQKFQGTYQNFTDSLDENENYDEWEAEFSHGATLEGDSTGEDGEIVNGVTFHDDAGVSRAGVEIPAGTVEIYGPHVELSETAPPSGSGGGQNLSLIALTAAPGEHEGEGTSEISVDVENATDVSTTGSLSLYIDDERVESRSVTLEAGEEKAVEFSYFFSEYGSYDVSVNDELSVTVEVVYAG